MILYQLIPWSARIRGKYYGCFTGDKGFVTRAVYDSFTPDEQSMFRRLDLTLMDYFDLCSLEMHRMGCRYLVLDLMTAALGFCSNLTPPQCVHDFLIEWKAQVTATYKMQ